MLQVIQQLLSCFKKGISNLDLEKTIPISSDCPNFILKS